MQNAPSQGIWQRSDERVNQLCRSLAGLTEPSARQGLQKFRAGHTDAGLGFQAYLGHQMILTRESNRRVLLQQAVIERLARSLVRLYSLDFLPGSPPLLVLGDQFCKPVSQKSLANAQLCGDETERR